MIFYPSYIWAYMLLSYKWDWMGWVGSLCGATIRASLRDANNPPQNLELHKTTLSLYYVRRTHPACLHRVTFKDHIHTI